MNWKIEKHIWANEETSYTVTNGKVEFICNGPSSAKQLLKSIQKNSTMCFLNKKAFLKNEETEPIKFKYAFTEDGM